MGRGEGSEPAVRLLEPHPAGPGAGRDPAPEQDRAGARVAPTPRRARRQPSDAPRTPRVADGSDPRPRLPPSSGCAPGLRLVARAAGSRRDALLHPARPVPAALGVHGDRGARGRARRVAPTRAPHRHGRSRRAEALAQSRRLRTRPGPQRARHGPRARRRRARAPAARPDRRPPRARLTDDGAARRARLRLDPEPEHRARRASQPAPTSRSTRWRCRGARTT